MLSDLQTKAAQAIVNIFETSKVLGDYAKVTLAAHDTGGLTYGKAQTTLASGNLFKLIRLYCDQPDAREAAAFAPYLDGLEASDRTLDHDEALKRLLRQAGDDPVMRAAQDRFFDETYWQPALKSADYIGARTALGCSIIYDGRVHGSWHALRDQVIEEFGTLAELGEATWFAHYVAHRRNWLASHSNRSLPPTVYRMDSYKALMTEENWNLDPPFTVKGHSVTEAGLRGVETPAPIPASPARPLLKRRQPMMRGPEVEALQQALRQQDIDIGVDGFFGEDTEAAVRVFQDRMGLEVDGVAGDSTWAALGF